MLIECISVNKLPITLNDLSTPSGVNMKSIVDQIRKEFMAFNFEVLQGDFYERHINEIRSYLRYDIDDFYHENHHLFKHFLYRVDLSEQDIQTYVQNHVFEDVYECIAELIIIKSAQKVYYKQKYSS